MSEEYLKESEWPKSKDEAVEKTIELIGKKELVETISKAMMGELHRGLGLWMRNNFGLWKGNLELLIDCGGTHPDDASGSIIEKLTEFLRDDIEEYKKTSVYINWKKESDAFWKQAAEENKKRKEEGMSKGQLIEMNQDLINKGIELIGLLALASQYIPKERVEEFNKEAKEKLGVDFEKYLKEVTNSME